MYTFYHNVFWRHQNFSETLVLQRGSLGGLCNQISGLKFLHVSFLCSPLLSVEGKGSLCVAEKAKPSAGSGEESAPPGTFSKWDSRFTGTLSRSGLEANYCHAQGGKDQEFFLP